jgi:23S rRNA (pseudouridine1915-N3)-methyltransferase
MRVLVAAVGKVKGGFAAPIADYEGRVRRYFTLETAEVKEQPARGGDLELVRQEEGKRLLARVPAGLDVITLDRLGEAWTSERLAGYLSELGLRGRSGACFLIGGAFGLSPEVLAAADHRLSISAFTLPHELARLVLMEQLYRAGTIMRGEPYHKSRDAK